MSLTSAARSRLVDLVITTLAAAAVGVALFPPSGGDHTHPISLEQQLTNDGFSAVTQVGENQFTATAQGCIVSLVYTEQHWVTMVGNERFVNPTAGIILYSRGYLDCLTVATQPPSDTSINAVRK